MNAISIWQFNFNEYESLISLGNINTIERQAFHLFLNFFVVVYCISFHILFSHILWLIVRFCFFVCSCCRVNKRVDSTNNFKGFYACTTVVTAKDNEGRQKAR